MPVVPCPSPCPPVVKGVVQFSDAEFIALWPEFTGIPSATAQNAFNLATLILDNSCASAVQDANNRMTLLYLLTAHETFLNAGSNDGAGNVTPPPGVVGRVDTAAEGSVNVSAQYSSEIAQSQAYFIQTKYGAKFWEVTARYRTARYIPSPAFGPNGPGYPFDFEGIW